MNAGSIGGQLCRDKECPISSITNSGRVWRKVLESDAWSVTVCCNIGFSYSSNVCFLKYPIKTIQFQNACTSATRVNCSPSVFAYRFPISLPSEQRSRLQPGMGLLWRLPSHVQHHPLAERPPHHHRLHHLLWHVEHRPRSWLHHLPHDQPATQEGLVIEARWIDCVVCVCVCVCKRRRLSGWEMKCGWVAVWILFGKMCSGIVYLDERFAL